MRNKQEKGSVLIASLWMLSIFSVLMTSLTFEGFQHTYLMKRELNGFQSKIDFGSALEIFRQALLTDPKPHEDSKQDSWYGTLDLPQEWKKKIEIISEDEESKLNLNFAQEDHIKVFLKAFEEEISSLKGDRKAFVKQIIKLRSKGRISSFEELFLLEDIEEEDLEKLRPYLSVYPDLPQMNINTIDPLVLKALIHSLTEDHFTEEELVRKISEYQEKIKSQEMPPFTQDELTPEVFHKKLVLRKSLPMLSLINRFLPFMATDSRTYHLRIKAQSGKEVQAALKDQAEGFGLDVLSWNET